MAHRSKKKHLKHLRRQERMQQAQTSTPSSERNDDPRRERQTQRSPMRERNQGG